MQYSRLSLAKNQFTDSCADMANIDARCCRVCRTMAENSLFFRNHTRMSLSSITPSANNIVSRLELCMAFSLCSVLVNLSQISRSREC